MDKSVTELPYKFYFSAEDAANDRLYVVRVVEYEGLTPPDTLLAVIRTKPQPDGSVSIDSSAGECVYRLKSFRRGNPGEYYNEKVYIKI